MQLTKEDIEVIKKFNRNVDWLKKRQLIDPVPSTSTPNYNSWLTVREATQFINRSRSWIARITLISANDAADPSMILIKGLDWKRETNRIYYKRSSLENLKKGMEKAGDMFDSRLVRHEPSSVV